MVIDNSRILVTGGAGFIGSNLVEDLLSRNNDVVVLDNFSTGKRENLKPFEDNPRFRLIEGDIRDYSACQTAVDGVDYVLHQAALGSVPRSINDPMTSTSVNIVGFVNMLHAAVQANIKRFVYAASSSTYGDIADSPKVEHRIGKPLSPYAITKYVDELFAQNFHDLYGIDTVGLRYFNVFGRRQDPFATYTAVIPSFARQLLKHERPVINGDGSITRDFTYIANVVEANNRSLTANNPDALNQVYNVAVGASTSINELFTVLRDTLAHYDSAIASIEAVHGPARKGDVQHSLASIEKARRLLGYAPQYDFNRGIKEAARWYYENL